MKKIFKSMGLLCIALVLGSCSQEQPDRSAAGLTQEADITQREHLAMGIQALAEEVSSELSSLERTEEGKASQTRSLQFEIQAGRGKNVGSVVPRIDTAKMNHFDAVVTYYNATLNQSFSASSRFTKKTSTTLGRNLYHMEEVDFPAAWNVRTANPTIYMQVVTGTGGYQNNRLSVGEETAQLPQLELKAGKTTFTAQAPFASAWRQIRWDSALRQIVLSKQTTAADKILSLKPQGIFLVFSLENWITLGVNVERTMQLESNGYTSRGYYDMSKFRSSLGASAIAEGSEPDLSKSWSTTNAETEPSQQSQSFREMNKRHYISKFKLMPGAGETDTPIHLSKRTGNAAVQYGKYYILWLQRINPEGGKNLIYASADINESGRTRYTTDQETYRGTIQPNTWKPRLGKRYIIGSFSSKNRSDEQRDVDMIMGAAYRLPLRMVRPMLPIEYMSWPTVTYNHAVNNNGSPTGQRLGWFRDFYDGKVASKEHWRLPKSEEIYHMTSTCSYFLQSSTPPTFGTGTSPTKAVAFRDQGYKFTTFAPGTRYVDIGGRTKLFYPIAWYVRQAGSNTIYAMMYRGDQRMPADAVSAGAVNTMNYCVFVRYTLGFKAWRRGDRADKTNVLKIEQYYVGPHLYDWYEDDVLSYALTSEFWDKLIDKQAVYTREIMFTTSDPTPSGDGNFYWLDNGDVRDDSRGTKINNFGRSDGYAKGSDGYFLPWLKDQYRSW